MGLPCEACDERRAVPTCGALPAAEVAGVDGASRGSHRLGCQSGLAGRSRAGSSPDELLPALRRFSAKIRVTSLTLCHAAPGSAAS